MKSNLFAPVDIETGMHPSDIEKVLNEGVARQVKYARAHSPLYQGKLANAPEVLTVEDLRRLPITTKQEVSRENDRFWSAPREAWVDVCTTSGTTGLPTLYPITDSDLERLALNEFLCFSRVGIEARDTVILAVTIDKCFMAGLAYFEGLRRRGATVVRVGAGSPAMLLSMIDRLNPTAIVSVPSFLKRVAAYARQQGRDLRKAGVRKLICIGEPVRNLDWSLTALGAQISSDWNARVYSTYGNTELASSLCECQAGKGGHLHPQLLHIEILNDAGGPAADGEVGQLVATTIGVSAMPMIRFATGDVTFMTRERCECGLWTPRIGPILGRKDQAMKLKGTTVYPAAVQRALSGLDGVIDFIMIATAPTALSDELEVLVAWRGDSSGAVAMIEERLRGELKVCPSVRLVSEKEIQVLGDSRELRKQRVFLDRRK